MSAIAKSTEANDGWAMSGRRERAVMMETSLATETVDVEREFPTSRGRLTPAEIEALLRPDLSDLDDEEQAPESAEITNALTPDFAKSDLADPDHTASEEITSRLSLALRQDCEFEAAVDLVAVQSSSFRTAIEHVQPDWATVLLGDISGRISGALLLSPNLASAFIEAACGGLANDPGLSRTLTPVDVALLGTLVAPLAKAARDGLSVVRIETDARYAALLVPPATVMVMRLKVLSGSQSTEAALILDEGRDQNKKALEGPEGHAAPQGVTAALTARIATLSVPVSRLANLKPGSTLLLGLPQDQPVELLSGGRNGALIAEGEIGRKGNKMAIRISNRGPMLRKRD